MVDVSLVIGMVLERDATHLLLSDGSEIFSPNELLFAEVSAGTGRCRSRLRRAEGRRDTYDHTSAETSGASKR
jgi:hypothetical protein